jgi:hypothetical protein
MVEVVVRAMIAIEFSELAVNRRAFALATLLSVSVM